MVVFRADGNPAIGSGHIMRCLSIADAGRAYLGQDILFVLASGHFREIVENRGYACAVLETDYRCMDMETEKMAELIHCRRPSAVFVDSYYAGFRYLERLQAEVNKTDEETGGGPGRLVCIDDVMSFAYPCDVLVNYNMYGPDRRGAYEEMYTEAHVPVPQMLLGPEFAPLRAQFQGLPERVVRRKAKNILILTGGADPEHIAVCMAEYMAAHRQEQETGGFRFHFVIGAMNGDGEKIRSIASGDSRMVLHFNVEDMGLLMCQADVAVSAAGSTLYELCAAQTPALTYILADNQIPGAESFERRGILRGAGAARGRERERIGETLLKEAVKLAEDYEQRKEISARQRKLTDGNGAERIVKAACLNGSRTHRPDRGAAGKKKQS